MSVATWQDQLERVDKFRWRIPLSYKSGMRVPGLIYANEAMLGQIVHDKALEQVANVAHLPGIVGHALAMPDIHWGYGFPIGGVAATDPAVGGVISPGGVGYDINCGVRLIRTDLKADDVDARKDELVASLFNHVPTGVGQSGSLKLNDQHIRCVVRDGARWVVERGEGDAEDLTRSEANGAMADADPDAISDRAYQRGRKQLGTLGSGNHFLELQRVAEIFDTSAAEAFGLFEGQSVIMIHTGSRGFGYQVCDDYLRVAERAMQTYRIHLPDRQLACMPVTSSEGQQYLSAMRGAANFAWANRQRILHLTRQVFERIFGQSWRALGLRQVYDVAHNIAKFEPYDVDGQRRELCIHRKGATRAYGPGHAEICQEYRDVGQPVMIPGDMGRHSFVLIGTAEAASESFGTTCHGAGRLMSRKQAVRHAKGRSIVDELAQAGVTAMAKGYRGLAEEQPAAYKDVREVVDVVHGAGLARKVCRLQPMGVIKG